MVLMKAIRKYSLPLRDPIMRESGKVTLLLAESDSGGQSLMSNGSGKARLKNAAKFSFWLIAYPRSES